MLTPYDWQESIGQRAQYIESKLAQGTPVFAVSCPEGIVLVTRRRTSRKIYEIYDRLAYSAIGQQSDVEALRTAALDFAHREGYNRSEFDVTIRRVATALSEPLKKAFGNFSAAPFVLRCLFAEVCETPADDLYYVIDFDGDYIAKRGLAIVAGTPEYTASLESKVSQLPRDSVDTLVDALDGLLLTAPEDEKDDFFVEASTMTLEAVLFERSEDRQNRFQLLREG